MGYLISETTKEERISIVIAREIVMKSDLYDKTRS